VKRPAATRLGRRLRALAGRTPSRRGRSPASAIGRRLPASVRDRVANRVLGTPEDPDAFAGRKSIAAITGAAFGAVAGGHRWVVAAGILGAGGWRWPEFRLVRREEAHRRAVLRALPDTLDVLAACVRAGASVGGAFSLASQRENGPLGDAMRAAVGALDHGLRKEEAYALLCERARTPEVRSVVNALRRAERLGTSVASTLVVLAQDMRERRRAAAEEEVRGAPVRMLFPVIVCFLPAFVLLTIVPVLLVAIRGFRFG
jgi:tight adherence protein C